MGGVSLCRSEHSPCSCESTYTSPCPCVHRTPAAGRETVERTRGNLFTSTQTGHFTLKHCVWSERADLQIKHSHQFVQTSGHHHLPQDGHHSDGVTVALVDPHQISCLEHNEREASSVRVARAARVASPPCVFALSGMTHVDVVCVDTLVTGAAEHQVTDHLTGRAEEKTT